MIWTQGKPTASGLYQYRPPHAGLVVFYRVEEGPSSELVVTHDDTFVQVDVKDLPGEWRGPILDASAWRQMAAVTGLQDNPAKSFDTFDVPHQCGGICDKN